MKNMILALTFALLLFGCTQPAEETTAPLSEEPAEEDTNISGESEIPEPAPETVQEAEPAAPPENPVQGIPSPGPAFSAADLAQHGNVFDCWVVYKGQVYDVTGYIPLHEGGTESITPYCGRADNSFTEAFEGQHGTDKVDVLQSMGVLQGVLQG